jgi:hypothetical protein
MADCYWCGKPAIGEVLIEKERKKKDPRTMVMMTLAAKMAPACFDHINILKEQPLFYTGCGCTYVEDHLKCPRHNRPLDSISKVRILSHGNKPNVLGSNGKGAK